MDVVSVARTGEVVLKALGYANAGGSAARPLVRSEAVLVCDSLTSFVEITQSHLYLQMQLHSLLRSESLQSKDLTLPQQAKMLA